MLRLLARTLIVLAMCSAIGLQWVALQSVAWATMFADYSQRVPLATALAQTFDGNHACDLCKGIFKARNSQQRRDTQVPIKPDLICVTRAFVWLPPYEEVRYPRFVSYLIDNGDSPPVPPPRVVLT